jgi:hypothetical protein
MAQRDWHEWHAAYDHPGSGLARRLSWVQERIRAALDAAPVGQVRAISLCAGQGRDLIGALADHPRARDVTARLVELDPRNTEAAARLAAESGLDNVEVVTGDASLISQYVGLVPADLVLACGLFGNMTDAHVEQTIGYLGQLCAEGGTVVWTRARWSPDLVPRVCAWFEGRGFERVSLTSANYVQCVGAHRRTAPPAALEPGAVMFTFTNHHARTGPARF